MTFQLPIIAYGLIGFALWFSEFHRRDMMHLIYGCPLLVVALWLLWDAVDWPRLVRILAPSTLGVSLLFVAVNHGWRAATADEHIVTRRGTIVMPTDDPALRFLLSSEVSRGDYVFVYPYYPTYNISLPTSEPHAFWRADVWPRG